MSLYPKRVEDLAEGDLVDLESCPFMSNHPMAGEQYAEVSLVEQETPACVLISYEGIDHVGYPTGTVLNVFRQESALGA